MRVFLALDLPVAIRSQLVLQQFLMPVKRKQPPGNFHITMVFLGDAQPDALDDLDAALSRLELECFTIKLMHSLHGGGIARIPAG